jgi:hypothetical protein
MGMDTKSLTFQESGTEPEDLIGSALYLLQLCQQDLNMGRKTTIWARARRARECCEELERMCSDENCKISYKNG